jgi:hypothetical protein
MGGKMADLGVVSKAVKKQLGNLVGEASTLPEKSALSESAAASSRGGLANVSADAQNAILAQIAKQDEERRKKQEMVGPAWRGGIRRGSQTIMGSAGLSAGR